ncbi:diphthine--ammonia ligase [Candidatus Woesearchaeota archaeon]|nr:diphthine--ammonia ligase [Candidatus Woesearchaeota archaeon]
MKLAVLFSGGKDSSYALLKALESEEHEVVCLVSLISQNKESFMFHTPNISMTKLQAEAIGLPLIEQETMGEKEKELLDLKIAIQRAREEHGVEGVVTGAIESVYQASRVQAICDELGLWCFNPLWKKDQEELMRDLISRGFEVIISGVFAYPLNEGFLGRKLSEKLLDELLVLEKKYRISPSGEGGEIETTVLDAPFFRKKIKILDFEPVDTGGSWVFSIKDAGLVSR